MIRSLFWTLIFSLFYAVNLQSAEPSIFINRNPSTFQMTQLPFSVDKPLKIAILSSPKTIGKYTQSIYNASLATLIGRNAGEYVLQRYDMNDESSESIAQALIRIRQDGMNAILAPLTSGGTRNLLAVDNALPVFIPTVHHRDFPSSSENITFGAIDYESQIEALQPYMSDSIAIFYDSSSVGQQLKSSTETIFMSRNSAKKKVASFPVDIKGDKIVSHLSNPSAFNKKSIIMHIPVVKSSVLAAHLTFTGVKEKNILSTQINVDPTLLTLTQYNDRKNMILANSLVEFPPSIYETNDLFSSDIAFDWVLYASTVGIDYLASILTRSPREYTMRIVNDQVIYPIELLQAKEFGFEPLKH